MKTIVAALLLLGMTSNAQTSDSTYDAVIAGKQCQEDKNQSLSCSYKVGNSLYIEIAGIGSPDTGISFLKSDYDGDYYGSYGLLHGCIIIKSTKNVFNFAFVSPKNGKVYITWQECNKAM
jgi:hypothetical protein